MSPHSSIELADRFRRFKKRIAAGSVTTQEWIEFGKDGSAWFERYRSAGDDADPEDLRRAHQIASAGAQGTEGALKEQFYTLLTSVLLVQHRLETDPQRHAAVARIARELCSAYEKAGNQHSLRIVFDIAYIWEECALSGGPVEEAAEARDIADRALSGLHDESIDHLQQRAESAWRHKRWSDAADAYDSVRKLPGFQRFSIRALWSDVTDASAAIPLVYVASTDLGTVVIGVDGRAGRAPSGHVTVRTYFVEAVTPSTLVDRSRRFLELEVERQGATTSDSFEELLGALRELLEWLSASLLIRVRLLLGDARSAAFIISGLLSLLQIPAAATAAEDRIADFTPPLFTPPLPDIAVTLVPSARSYCEARERAAQSEGGDADLRGTRDQEGADREAATVAVVDRDPLQRAAADGRLARRAC